MTHYTDGASGRPFEHGITWGAPEPASPLEHAFKAGVSFGIEWGARDSSQRQGETDEQAKCDAWLAYEATMGVRGTSGGMTYDEAIDALCGCAATVTVLSYQEAIEGYFKLRGIEQPAPPEKDGEPDLIAGNAQTWSLRCLNQVRAAVQGVGQRKVAQHMGISEARVSQALRGGSNLTIGTIEGLLIAVAALDKSPHGGPSND